MKTHQFSSYLSLESSQARIIALLDRIERECRRAIFQAGRDFDNRSGDYWKLPHYLRMEIDRRLLCPS